MHMNPGITPAIWSNEFKAYCIFFKGSVSHDSQVCFNSSISNEELEIFLVYMKNGCKLFPTCYTNWNDSGKV